ncbi:hypothetical protein GCM10008992_25600 [Halorubrum aquaticum]
MSDDNLIRADTKRRGSAFRFEPRKAGLGGWLLDEIGVMGKFSTECLCVDITDNDTTALRAVCREYGSASYLLESIE